ncbi:MAG: YgiQ family radical SAM protein [Desulfoprunum sp.]
MIAMRQHTIPLPGDRRPLPICWEECRRRGWDELDILLVTGDAYVDHPSFGIALIARLLDSRGYRVAILPQPRYDRLDDFRQFPAPRLFCGITGGNLDSIVANYSGNGKVRDFDAFSPAGNPWRGEERSKANRRRPDRAVLLYAQLARAAFGETLLVLGGIEASLRRFVHYDYKQEKLRSSSLTDAKADLLVYGMGERAVLTIAERIAGGEATLDGIPGTCRRLSDKERQEKLPDIAGAPADHWLLLPSWADIGRNPALFLDQELQLDHHARAASGKIVLQRQQSHWVIQYPPAAPLGSEELDALHALPFSRRPHPAAPDIPAYRMIRDSVTIVRGCSGNCSFCAITRHQGPKVISRSRESIVTEVKLLSRMDDFGGTISDLGGPTANLWGTSCAIGGCARNDCLYPRVCPNLQVAEQEFLQLLDTVASVAGIEHVFISSGLRMGLLLKTPALLRRIIERHTPGAMKIAPEHTDADLLTLMHKEPHAVLRQFIRTCRQMARELSQDLRFSPYIITAHPGSSESQVRQLVKDLRALELQVRAFQDFTPTPGTISTAMFVTGRRRDTKEPLTVPKNASERKKQREIIEREYLKASGPARASRPARRTTKR